MPNDAPPWIPPKDHFRTTRWSIVQTVGAEDSKAAREALVVLCEAYWYPLYAYVRRSGRSADEAADLTQAFFARLLEKRDVRSADPTRGKFRSYLLGSLRHFLANEQKRAHALKRGGGRIPISFNAGAAESRYAREPIDRLTPERLYERNWALALLERSLERLKAEYDSQGKARLFDCLQGTLTTDQAEPTRRELASKLDMTDGAIKVAIHRLRRRFRAKLRAEILDTVTDPKKMNEELHILLQALDTGNSPPGL